MDQTTAERWMQEALVEARRAEAEGEVPVGAVLLVNEKIVGRGHNHCIRLHDPTAHAEIQAIRHGARSTGNYRLPGSVLIVTLEPCAMCVGAMIHARVDEVLYGASDPRAGAIRSNLQLADARHWNHRIAAVAGILEEECSRLLREFFESRR